MKGDRTPDHANDVMTLDDLTKQSQITFEGSGLIKEIQAYVDSHRFASGVTILLTNRAANTSPCLFLFQGSYTTVPSKKQKRNVHDSTSLPWTADISIFGKGKGKKVSTSWVSEYGSNTTTNYEDIAEFLISNEKSLFEVATAINNAIVQDVLKVRQIQLGSSESSLLQNKPFCARDLRSYIMSKNTGNVNSTAVQSATTVDSARSSDATFQISTQVATSLNQLPESMADAFRAQNCEYLSQNVYRNGSPIIITKATKVCKCVLSGRGKHRQKCHSTKCINYLNSIDCPPSCGGRCSNQVCVYE